MAVTADVAQGVVAQIFSDQRIDADIATLWKMYALGDDVRSDAQRVLDAGFDIKLGKLYERLENQDDDIDEATAGRMQSIIADQRRAAMARLTTLLETVKGGPRIGAGVRQSYTPASPYYDPGSPHTYGVPYGVRFP